MNNNPRPKKKVAHGLVALKLEVPSKDAIALLPPYKNGSRRAVVINNAKALRQAAMELASADVIGFDTESKPTFAKGEAPNPVALLQLATDKVCFMIQPLQLENKINDMEPIRALMERTDILKVGAGLKADKHLLKREFKMQLNGIVDLVSVFNTLGYKNDMGVKTMIAMLQQQQLKKSKRLSRSNWAAPSLSPEQLQYASDDAFAPVDVYRQLAALISTARHQPEAHIKRYISNNRSLFHTLGIK